MLNKRFTTVIGILIVVLELTAIVLTFVGAFLGGDTGKGLLFTGMFCFVAIAVLGWVMIAVYNRVHKDEQGLTEIEADSDETEIIQNNSNSEGEKE